MVAGNPPQTPKRSDSAKEVRIFSGLRGNSTRSLSFSSGKRHRSGKPEYRVRIWSYIGSPVRSTSPRRGCWRELSSALGTAPLLTERSVSTVAAGTPLTRCRAGECVEARGKAGPLASARQLSTNCNSPERYIRLKYVVNRRPTA